MADLRAYHREFYAERTPFISIGLPPHSPLIIALCPCDLSNSRFLSIYIFTHLLVALGPGSTSSQTCGQYTLATVPQIELSRGKNGRIC